MARTKGSANLAASLEILAEAPVDARTVVAAESDLTVAANFPYAYVGMPVYVKATQKMYVLTATPVTTASNWKEVGSGGSSFPSGGTTGQALVKHSNTDQDVEWATIDGTPSGGTTGQLLAKHSNTDGDVEWVNAPSSIPDGGTTGQVLAKHSDTDGDVEWADKNVDVVEVEVSSANDFNNINLVSNGETKIFHVYTESTLPSEMHLPLSSETLARHYHVEVTKTRPRGSGLYLSCIQRCRVSYKKSFPTAGVTIPYNRTFERMRDCPGQTWGSYSDWVETSGVSVPVGGTTGQVLAKTTDYDGTVEWVNQTTYESKAAQSGGTAVSLCTTGEKYTWNNKQDALSNSSYLAKIGEQGGLPTYDGQIISLPTVHNFDKSNLYSTTEQVVGCWTDGRPLYQKTIDFGALPNATNKSVAHGISNINYITSIKGTAYNSSSPMWLDLSLPHPEQLILAITVIADKTNITVIAKSDRRTLSALITLQYTKTTDAANSFKYASENDYSTTEKIVGTWIDGKPLYQKTLTGTMLSPSSDGTEKTTDFSIGASVAEVASCNAIVTYTASGVNNRLILPFAKSGTQVVRHVVRTNADSVPNVVRLFNTWAIGSCPIKITIQYTKTTD